MRLFRQVREMISLRREGYRLTFVRISRPAALIVSIFGPLLGFRSLFWLSGTVLDLESLKPTLKRIKDRFLLDVIIRRTTYLATGPESMVQYYMDNLGLPRNKIQMLYNDIDITAFPPGSKRTDDGEYRLLLVHRLSPVRRTDLYFPRILEAMRTALMSGQKVRLDVVGSGSEMESLKKVVSDFGTDVDVTFHGALPNNQLNRFYQAADIFLMPSYREGFPRVLLEAMSHGLPIVSTDAGGVRDILGPQQVAYVTDRDDTQGFGTNIEIMLSHPQIWSELREENLSWVQRFSTPAVAEMYDEAFSSILRD